MQEVIRYRKNATFEETKPTEIMKKLFWHYVVLIVPAALILLTYFLFNYNVWLLAGLILVWALLYIPFFNGRRLYLKGLVPKQKFLYSYIDEEFWQFWREIYFRP